MSTDWSSQAKDYNAQQSKPLTYAGIKACFNSDIFALLDSTLSKASEGDKIQILTLACGTGSELLVLFDHYGINYLKERVEILATDYAEGMVEVTRELSQTLGVDDFVKVKQMDAQRITLDDDSQDVVLFPFGPMIVPDPISSLSEVLRVLKPHGLSVNITPASMDFYSILDDAKAKVLTARGLDRNKDKEEAWSFYENKAIVEWGKPENAKKHLLKAGFKDENVFAKLIELDVEIEDWKASLSSLKTNPGMSYFWNTLSNPEAEIFWKFIHQSYKERYGEDGKCVMRQGVVSSWAWK